MAFRSFTSIIGNCIYNTIFAPHRAGCYSVTEIRRLRNASAEFAMLKMISLFSGIGGLDFGFEEAGYKTRVALEFDKFACRTLRLNRRWDIIEDDINLVSSNTLLDR